MSVQRVLHDFGPSLGLGPGVMTLHGLKQRLDALPHDSITPRGWLRQVIYERLGSMNGNVLFADPYPEETDDRSDET